MTDSFLKNRGASGGGTATQAICRWRIRHAATLDEDIHSRKISSGFGATAIGPMVTILAQIISVPVFLRSWGPRLYGEWLILSAIPTHIAFSDRSGFGNVAANDMTMRVASPSIVRAPW